MSADVVPTAAAPGSSLAGPSNLTSSSSSASQPTSSDVPAAAAASSSRGPNASSSAGADAKRSTAINDAAQDFAPPSPSWLRSIDAVYDLFEMPELRRKYPRLSMLVWEGVRLCEEVVRELGLEHCALSFNGGKDCTVLVHMLAAVLRRLNGHTYPPNVRRRPTSTAPAQQDLIPIPSIYITCPSPFPTLESFVRASIRRYHLRLHTVRGPMKPALIEYFHGGGVAGVPALGSAEREREESGQSDGRAMEEVGGVEGRVRKVKAVFIGTRRTDPAGASLGPRTPTDAGWPQVDRIHPILDWSYHDVWAFLRCPELGDAGDGSSEASSEAQTDAASRKGTQEGLQGPALVPESTEDGTCAGGKNGVPYCLLYDQGYTSLGSTFNTVPNPILRIDATSELCTNTSTTSPGPSIASATQPPDSVLSNTPPSTTTSTPRLTVGDGTATGLWKPAYMLPDGSSERAGRLRGQVQTDVVKDCQTVHTTGTEQGSRSS